MISLFILKEIYMIINIVGMLLLDIVCGAIDHRPRDYSYFH